MCDDTVLHIIKFQIQPYRNHTESLKVENIYKTVSNGCP